MKKKLAIVTTHPIQYYAPLFRQLAKIGSADLKVFYTKGTSENMQFEPDFGKSIAWDIPLLDGYDYHFSENKAKKSNGFLSIINKNLIEEISDWQADQILVFGWSYLSHLNVMNYFSGKIPVFFRGDSNLLDEKAGLKTILRRLFLKWVYSKVDIAFYVGIANKQYYLKHGLAESQLVFAPHAVENERFSAIDYAIVQKAKEWRVELGIGENEKAVLFVGKFINKKNPKLLLDAFKRVENKKLHLIFVGNGPLENEMKSVGDTLPNIHFIPFQNQSQMPIIYLLGDIFCLPSKGPGETWGLAVNEAMACGKAVLVSNKCGCVFDLVENGLNGYVFQSENEQELAARLAQMLDGDLQKMGNASLKKVTNYSIAKIVRVIETTIAKPISQV